MVGFGERDEEEVRWEVSLMKASRRAREEREERNVARREWKEAGERWSRMGAVGDTWKRRTIQ